MPSFRKQNISHALALSYHTVQIRLFLKRWQNIYLLANVQYVKKYAGDLQRLNLHLNPMHSLLSLNTTESIVVLRCIKIKPSVSNELNGRMHNYFSTGVIWLAYVYTVQLYY